MENQDKQVKYEVNGNEVKLNMNYVRMNLVSGDDNAQKNVKDAEIINFMMMAKHNKLDPFLNEAYLVKFNNRAAQMIVSKEAFMKRAEASEKYEGFEAGVIVVRNGELVEQKGALTLPTDELVGGWARVYRSDRRVPIESQISLKEFSKGQATWKNMPATMIRKTAIVNALREAFPQALGAMYTEDDRDVKNIQAEEVQTDQEKTTTNIINNFKSSGEAPAPKPTDEVIEQNDEPETFENGNVEPQNEEIIEVQQERIF